MPDNEKKPKDIVLTARAAEMVSTANPATVIIEKRISDLERVTKILENWREEDKKDNRKWRWITVGLAVFAIILAIVLKAF